METVLPQDVPKAWMNPSATGKVEKSKPVQHSKAPVKPPPRRSSAPMRAPAAGGDKVAKPKQSKSRNGCVTCKKKRLKCDETKPHCLQCKKRSAQCEGYKKDYKWRTAFDTDFEKGKPESRPKKAPDNSSPTSATKPAFAQLSPQQSLSSESSFGSNLGNDIAGLHDPFPIQTDYQQPLSTPTTFQHPLPSANGFLPPSTHANGNGFHSQLHQFHPPQPPDSLHNGNRFHDSQTSDSLRHDHAFPGFSPTFSSQPFPVPTPQQLLPQSTHTEPMNLASPMAGNAFADSPANVSTPGTGSSTGLSPRLKLEDLCEPGTVMNQGFSDMDIRPARSPTPYQPGGYVPPPDLPSLMSFPSDGSLHLPQEMDEDVEEIPRQADIDQNIWDLQFTSPIFSEIAARSTRMFMQPTTHLDSPEALMHRFDRQTCGILSVKDGPTENPWRTLIYPLARSSGALWYSIASLTAFHTAKEYPQLKSTGIQHFRTSLQDLFPLVAQQNVDHKHTHTMLATTLVLAFSDSWDRHTSSGIAHLRAAKSLVTDAIKQHQKKPLRGDALATGRFLSYTWLYMDVIARLTSADDDGFEDFEGMIAPWRGPIDSMMEVDPLMGCATTLFPLIGKVANLVQKVRKTEGDNDYDIIQKASELKRDIEYWQPSGEASDFEKPEDLSSEVEHSLQTAEAYRYATLLYLHQAVPELPSEPTAVLAKKVLNKLASVPPSSRATIVHIYPLMAAGCEAVSEKDRAWVLNRWDLMQKRLKIGNIDSCVEVVKEVWSRRDDHAMEKQMLQARRAQSRGMSFTQPVAGMKRESSSGEDPFFFDDTGNVSSGLKRRATLSNTGFPQSIAIPSQSNSRKPSELGVEHMDEQMTVRGRMHWQGVMRERGWEVLLG